MLTSLETEMLDYLRETQGYIMDAVVAKGDAADKTVHLISALITHAEAKAAEPASQGGILRGPEGVS